MKTIPNVVSIVSVLALVLRATAADVAQQELAIINPASGAKLWASVHYPADASAVKKCPAVVFIPGGLGFGSGMARTPQPQALARAGFVVGYLTRERARSTEARPAG